MEIRDILKSRRLQLGLTLSDVAEKVGVSKATVSRWESGNIANMKRNRIVALANVLEISPSVIMGLRPKDDKSKSKESKVDVKDIINGDTFLFDGNDYNLNKADKEMLTNIIKTVLQGKEIK